MEDLKRYSITLDDDPIIYKIISQMTGINSLPFHSCATLLKRSPSYDPIAIFVDVHLSYDECGLDAIPHLRKNWPYTPIIVITSDPSDILVSQALATGANDFIRKPINAQELNARLHARIAEMSTRQNIDEIKVGELVFSKSHHSIRHKDKVTYLAKLEAQLFTILLENRGGLLTKDELKRRIWGSIAVSENTIDKKISRVRKALHEVSSDLVIGSIYGKGVSLQLNGIHNNESSSNSIDASRVSIEG